MCQSQSCLSEPTKFQHIFERKSQFANIRSALEKNVQPMGKQFVKKGNFVGGEKLNLDSSNTQCGAKTRDSDLRPRSLCPPKTESIENTCSIMCLRKLHIVSLPRAHRETIDSSPFIPFERQFLFESVCSHRPTLRELMFSRSSLRAMTLRSSVTSGPFANSSWRLRQSLPFTTVRVYSAHFV